MISQRFTLLCYVFIILPGILWGKGNLRFVPNKGQWEDPSRFRMERGNTVLFMEPGQLTLSIYETPCHGPHCVTETQPLHGHAVRIRFLDAEPQAEMQAANPFPERLNFYLGKNPEHWQSGLLAYGSVSYQNLYPGIGLRFYSEEDVLKYDFEVAPGADPGLIRLEYQGMERLFISEDGDLVATTPLGELREFAPKAYQMKEGERLFLPCRFHLENNVLGYRFPEGYDPSLPLVIDPILVFGTYSGASTSNWGYTATYDGQGNAYGGGVIFRSGYPTTPGAFQSTFQGGFRDVTLSKFSPDGSRLIFSTYLGGGDEEQPHSMVTGAYNDLYVYGRTFSSDFPTTPAAFDTSYNGQGDIFISRFDSLGRMMASTYLGGTDADGVISRTFNSSPLQYNYGDDARGEIDLDAQGNCLIATVTTSQDFPIKNIPIQGYQGGLDGCIAKLSQDLSQLIWASYFGGSGEDAIYSLAPADGDILYICGGSTSSNLPAKIDAPYPVFNGDVDGFVARIDLSRSQVQGCSYLGTQDMDQAYFVELDGDTSVYIFGQTTGNIDTIGQVYRVFRAKQFITKLSPRLDNIIFQTTFGTFWAARPDISPTAFLVDNCSRIYAAGWSTTWQGGFQGIPPLTSDAWMDTTDGSHFYLTVFEKDMDSLIYATLVGELTDSSRNSDEHVDGGTSRFDKQGVVYQAVCASCDGTSGFPTTPGAYRRLNGARAPAGGGGGCNLAVFKMDFQLPNLTARFLPEDPQQNSFFKGCSPMKVYFHNLSSAPSSHTRFAWDFGDGSAGDSTASPVHVFSQPGLYQVRLVAYDSLACDPWDTVYHAIEVYSSTLVDAGPDIELCRGQQVQIPAQANGGSQYLWTPSAGLSDPLQLTPTVSPDSSSSYILKVSDQDECESYDTLRVFVREPIYLEVSPDTSICEGGSIRLQALGASQYHWTPSGSLDESTRPDPIARPDSSTTYQVYGNPDSVCTDSAQVRIEVIEKPFTVAWGDPLRICAGQEVRLYASGGARLRWNTGAEGDSIVVRPRDSTYYQVTAYNGSCYTNTDTVFIEVLPYPIADFDMSLTEGFVPMKVQFHNTSQHANSYIWRFGDGSYNSTRTHPFHAFQDTGTYAINLEVSNELGCRNWKVQQVHVSEVTLYVPDAFSPNEDGINDVFYVGNYGLKSLDIKIFSRWGKQVFESSSPDFRWDGTYKGQMLPEGVYTYVLRAVGENDWEYPLQGTITLIR